jgi:flagellar protein FliT
MENFKEILKLTQLMVECLRQVHDDTMERGQLIEQIHQLIVEREAIIMLLNEPYSVEEKEMGKKIIQLNDNVSKEMDQLFREMKKEMKEVQFRKTQNYSYLRPYGKMRSTNGMYLDSKL